MVVSLSSQHEMKNKGTLVKGNNLTFLDSQSIVLQYLSNGNNCSNSSGQHLKATSKEKQEKRINQAICYFFPNILN